jgi:hypothetical protein
VFAVILNNNQGPTARFLSSGLEMLFPLATGVATALLSATDNALELQLTMPRKYAFTVSLRIGALLFWNSCLSFLVTICVFVLGLTFLPHPTPTAPLQVFLSLQLTWIPSLLVCTVFGFAASLLFQSKAASVSLLAGFWVMEIVFRYVFIGSPWSFPLFWFPATLFPDGISFSLWETNRLMVLGVAIVLLIISWPMLLFPERLLKGSHNE